MVDGSWAGPRGSSPLRGRPSAYCVPTGDGGCQGRRSLKGPALGHPANRLLLSQLWSSKKQRKLGERRKKKKRTKAKQTNNNGERKEKDVELRTRQACDSHQTERPAPRARPRARGPPAGPGVAKLGLQGQTDRYCIYWVWLLFSVCFIPDNRPLPAPDSWKTEWVLRQERSAAPAGLQGWGGGWGVLWQEGRGVGRRRKGAWGRRQCDPEPGGRQPAGRPPCGARAHP